MSAGHTERLERGIAVTVHEIDTLRADRDRLAAIVEQVRAYAAEQRLMAEELHRIDRPYSALPYADTATALERLIGDTP